jgi:hypothetical protein
MLAAPSSAQDEDFVSEMIEKSITVPEASERLARPVVKVVPPPQVPDSIDAWRPVTIDIAVTTGQNEVRRRISRTNQAVHVDMPDKGLEWLFVRNSVDPLRVYGQLVNHEDEVVLDHNDTALRDRTVARGWADVMTIGLRLDQLEGLQPSGESREAFGLQFVHLARPEGTVKTSPIDEVWWNADSGIPLQIIASNERVSWQQSLLGIDDGVNEAMLEDAARRYPQYKNMDLADWGEEFHEFH